jgi:hypothetical protein
MDKKLSILLLMMSLIVFIVGDKPVIAIMSTPDCF